MPARQTASAPGIERNARALPPNSRRAPSRVLRGASTLFALVVALGAAGCGNSLYIFHIGAAEEKVEHAKRIEADKHAPYEYYGAEARMTEAKRQAAEAEYGAAADLAEEAEVLANRAIKKAQDARALNGPAEGEDETPRAPAPATKKRGGTPAGSMPAAQPAPSGGDS